MAEYYMPTVVQPPIPDADMTALEALVLDHIFESQPEGDAATYYFARLAPSDLLEAPVADVTAALEAADPAVPSRATDLMRAALAAEEPNEGYLVLEPSAVPWEVVFQDIVRRSATLDHVTVVSALTCSKMNPHGFGGEAVVITSDRIMSKCTDEVVREFLDELETDPPKGEVGVGIHALVRLSEKAVRERVQELLGSGDETVGALVVTGDDVRAGCRAVQETLDFSDQKEQALGAAARAAIQVAKLRERAAISHLEEASATYLVDYPLRVFFDCSTAHLSAASIAYLAVAAGQSKARPLSWVAETPFGWFVWVEDLPGDEFPPDLAAIMRHAHGQGAEYILFDSDAPENPFLPIAA